MCSSIAPASGRLWDFMENSFGTCVESVVYYNYIYFNSLSVFLRKW
jgi:hypothetical protein